MGGAALADEVSAVTNQNTQLAIDVQPRFATRACEATYASCSAIQQTSPATGYLDMMVVLYGFDEATSVEYGLAWDALYFTAWKDCADLYVFTRTSSQSADVSQVWTSCISGGGSGGPGRTLGWLQLHGTSGRVDFTVTSAPADPSIVDCSFNPVLICSFHSGFYGGALPGPFDLDPCEVGASATGGMTWGRLKDLYR